MVTRTSWISVNSCQSKQVEFTLVNIDNELIQTKTTLKIHKRQQRQQQQISPIYLLFSKYNSNSDFNFQIFNGKIYLWHLVSQYDYVSGDC